MGEGDSFPTIFVPLSKQISIFQSQLLVFCHLQMLLTLSQTINFRLKELADDNFTCDENGRNGRKFSIWIENIVGKGEVAHIEQFLLFPQCFQKTYAAHM